MPAMSFSKVARSASKQASASLNDDAELLLAVAVGLEVGPPQLFECRGACPALPAGDSMAGVVLLLLLLLLLMVWWCRGNGETWRHVGKGQENEEGRSVRPDW
jgi:hypothetical protein